METEGGSQLFETAEKGVVMKNELLKGGGSCVPDHVEVHPQKKKEVLYFVKRKTGRNILESRVISCQNHSRTLNAVI